MSQSMGAAVQAATADKKEVDGAASAQASQKRGTTKTPNTKKAALMKSSAGFVGDEKSTLLAGGSLGIGGIQINLENIVIANYSCDFGNVVVGSTKKKTFRLTNVGKIPVTFNLDKKILA